MKYEHELLNELANNILGQVKPLYLRKEIISKVLDLVEKTVKQETQKLEQTLGGYMTDQEIWLTRNDALEKENAELRAKVTPAEFAYIWNEEKAAIEEVKEVEAQESENTSPDTCSCSMYDPTTMNVILKPVTMRVPSADLPTGNFSFNPKASKDGKEAK